MTHLPQGGDACLDLWGKKGEGFLEFTACKLTGQHTDPQQPGTAELPSQGSRFCLLIYPASKKEEAQLNGHTHTNTQRSQS